MQTHEFGWLPETEEYKGTFFTIHSLVDRDGFDYILNSPRAKDGWFYPPLEPAWHTALSNEPLVYAELFSLPATHRLTIPDDPDHAERFPAFVVELLGVLKGMQLVLQGWGHFYRTPIQSGELGDIKCVESSAVVRILDCAIQFWQSSPTARNSMYGAVHAHLFGCSYQHSFERFASAYAVLDTCWAVHTKLGRASHASHAERLPTMCAYYGLDLPSWGRVAGGRSRLSELRNEYFHESLWGGHPIGLGHPQDVLNIHLELFYLNTRLVIAMIGDRSGYTSSQGGHESWLLE